MDRERRITMLFLFALLLIGGYIFFHVMNNAERTRVVRTALSIGVQVKDETQRRMAEPDPFLDTLRERTPRPIVTAALAGLNVLIFLFMLVGPGSFSNPDTLIAWGGNFAPRTTNGEWWRLVTSMFVHAGLLSLLINMASLVTVGLILERLVGHLGFAVVYFVAGLFASLVSLPTHPLAVGVGASGAIFGLYGLLLASGVQGVMHPSPLSIPLRAFKTLSPAAAIFLLYNLASDGLFGEAELIGFVAGIGCGLALTIGVGEEKPTARRIAVPIAATAMTAVAFAVLLRGVCDARAEIQQVIAVEDRTASAYQASVEKFTRGVMSAAELAGLIDRTIMPELQATRARLKALEGVPQEQQPMVARADEYLRLRDESWRLRAAALRKSNSRQLREADKTERASLEAFEKIQIGLQK